MLSVLKTCNCNLDTSFVVSLLVFVQIIPFLAFFFLPPGALSSTLVIDVNSDPKSNPNSNSYSKTNPKPNPDSDLTF